MYHGLINVYKEPGFTSHDVVAKLRGIFGQKKIGHTGTLDPAAEGVLPVCLGQGTRLADMLTDQAEHPVEVTEEEVAKTAASFIGCYSQVPPMYSALKVKGKKLYELARAGKEVERQARQVQILGLSMDWIKLPRAGLTVTCSKGTYIRTLCDDIGKALGCGGCMERLKRTRVERFTLENSHTLSQIQQFRDEGRLGELIIPVEEMFDGPKAVFGVSWDGLALNGNPVEEKIFSAFLRKGGSSQEEAVGQMVRVYSSKGEFLGIYQYDQAKKRWKPKKMFLADKD